MKSTLLVALFLTCAIAANACVKRSANDDCEEHCVSVVDEDYVWQDSEGWGGTAFRAVDGNYNQQWGGESCSHTAIGNKHWWAVGFEEIYTFTNIRIYNRLDCCTDRLNHLKIYTQSDHKFDQNHPMKNMVECASWRTDRESPSIVDIYPEKPCTGKHVLIEMENPDNYLTLCEVEFCNRKRNFEALAPIDIKNNDVWQDSMGWGGLPNRANDGDTNQYYGGASCSHTEVGNVHWWAVEFNEESTFRAVRIYNRLDCCTERLNYITVYTSKSRHFADCNPMRDMVECAHWSTDESPGIVEIWADQPCTGKYALIEMKNPNNYLTLCEVEFRRDY